MYRISTALDSAYVEVEVAQDSVEKLIAFDASPAALVLIAHDPSLPKYLPALNRKGIQISTHVRRRIGKSFVAGTGLNLIQSRPMSNNYRPNSGGKGVSGLMQGTFLP